ncbi:MAG: zinc-ribbon domain-containing protein [Oscillospiraceae bacterium]
MVQKGFNDLAAKAPDVAAQWHSTLNGNLTPEMVTPGSHRRVCWQCPRGIRGKRLSIPARGRRGAAVPGLPAKAVRQIKSVLPQGGLYIDTSNIWRKVNEKTHIIPVADSLHGCDAFAHGSVC